MIALAADSSFLTVVPWLQYIFKAHAEAPALSWEDRTLSYGELGARVRALSSYLVGELGVRRGDLVGVCLEPSFDRIIALLAVLEAGAAYVPLDPDLPARRLAYTLTDAKVRTVLAQRKFAFDLEPCVAALEHRPHFLYLDDEALVWRRTAPTPMLPAARPDDAAYVIYTSGSTGEPKGVVVPHRGLVALARANVNAFELDRRVRLLQFASLSFDAATWEIFSALCAGATLVLGSREQLMPGRPLAEFLAARRVSMVCLPPSVLATLHDFRDSLPELRTVVVAGEACPLALARSWASPSRRFFNAYGPTEATVCTSMYLFRESDTSVPIGLPLPGWEVHLLDESLRPVADGQVGELYIGGVGVALGYLNKPELTARRFVRHPAGTGLLYRSGDLAVRREPHGLLEFAGRVDQQVKIRGLRVELEAVEHTLCEHPGVQHAAVKALETGERGARTLVAYVVPRSETPSPDSLRRFLADRLPEYMVPPLYVFLEALPLMANRSKVDRAALPPPPVQALAGGLESEDARRCAAIFERVLKLAPGSVGADSDFFHLGGDSLCVAHLVGALRQELGVEVPPRVVYAHPSPAELMAWVERRLASPEPARGTEDVDLLAESRLEEDLRPLSGTPGSEVALVTGATGFLGIFLLEELLARGPFRTVYCVVRAESDVQAARRLRATFEKYGRRTELLERVVALAGDVQRPRLGLSEAHYARLCAEVDVIYHSAADTHYVRHYAAMRGPNVDGTRHVLRLACTTRPKALHHVSSVCVYGAVSTLLGLEEVEEDFDLLRSLPLMAVENGYTKSKWVAERLVLEARARGLPVSIYRPGFIEGHSVTGVANVDDLLCRMLVGCIRMGLYPDLPRKFWLPAPVDFMARAIAVLSQRAAGGTYNLVPDRARELSHLEMFERLVARGYPMEKVSTRSWLQALHSLPPTNPLYPLTAYITEKVYQGRATVVELSHRMPVYQDDQTREGLRGSGVEVPPFDEPLLDRYLAGFKDAGLL
jgi:amino acid adenylation domain-containing protein/thioester reductase-like protein